MIFDGKQAAIQAKQDIAARVRKLTDTYQRRPCLQVILVGTDYGSIRYAESCIKQCTSVGMECRWIRLDEQSSQEQVLQVIEQANNDNTVDGILIQMPLPHHLHTETIVQHLSPLKDVDGVTDQNAASLFKQRHNDYSAFCVPCTPRSVMRILHNAHIDLDGKRAIVVGRSNIVGLPVSKLLMNENCTVTVAHSHTRNLPQLVQQADVIVAAIGQPRFITADMIREGSVVIDVGINSDPDTGKMCGDVDFEATEPKCTLITPVPGGVGPLTICSLMENTLDCYERKLIIEN